jgi:tetratricopeptide (TPR) repeat protein
MKVLAVDPDNGQAEENLRKAQAALDAAAGKKTEKERLQKWYADGVAALNAGRPQEAIECFEAIQTVRPGHQASLVRLEKAREMAASMPAAKPAPAVPAAPKPAARPAPRKSPAHAAKRELSKRDMETIYNRAVTLYNQGRYEDCIVEFRKILAVNPQHAPSKIRAEKARLALKRRG